MREIKNNSKKYKAGVTIIEMLVYLAIFIVVIGGITRFGRDIFFYNSVTQSDLTAQLEGRRVVKSMVAELRESIPSSLGAYPIAQVGTSSITFFTNVDSDSLKEQVRYYLLNKKIYKGTIKPSGNPLVYNPASETTKMEVSDVINGTSTPIFQYYDTNYAGSGNALASPVDIPSVRLIKVNVIIDRDSNRSPVPLSITSQVSIRNLKDNL